MPKEYKQTIAQEKQNYSRYLRPQRNSYMGFVNFSIITLEWLYSILYFL